MSESNKALYELNISDIRRHSIWYYNDILELYYPVLSLDTEVDGVKSLRIRTNFVSAKGDQLFGTISGKGRNIVSIYTEKAKYTANKRWPNLAEGQLGRLIEDNPDLKARTLGELLPLQWTTQIDAEPFKEWSGVFDMPELRGEPGLGDAVFPTEQEFLDHGLVLTGDPPYDD